MGTSSRGAVQQGNDLFREIALANGETFTITNWDVWLIIVLTHDFAGDWDALIDHWRGELTTAVYRRDTTEGLLSHLLHLRPALAEAGLTASDILADIPPAVLKSQIPKARRKILKDSPADRDKSYWMIHTPRLDLQARALRGYWSRFPVSPAVFAEPLARLYKSSGFYSEDQSFGLERKLSEFIERSEARASDAEQLALYRAALTVLIEEMDRVDDSYGVIGDLYSGVFDHYTRLDRAALNMPIADFFQDLIELLIWEDFGFTYHALPDFFAGLSQSEVPAVESILRASWEALRELALTYEAERALTLVGMFCTQQHLFDRFIDLAKIMGTRVWERITTMSEMAEKQRRPALAREVYEACWEPGHHENYLRKKHAELLERQAK
jgi:hypothetical protein